MIYSMTAFARTQSQGEWGSLICETRSINHRFLEISIHSPDLLHAFEMSVRERIRQFVKRGKIECNIRYQANPSMEGSLYLVNKPLVQELGKASEEIAALLTTTAPINPIDILRFPGVLNTKEADLTSLRAQLMHLLEKTLEELVSVRGREGEELRQLFSQRTESMLQELSKVRERLPEVMSEIQERLLKRFADVKIELDPGRLEQEMVMFAQKIDISEEIERAETHIKEISRVIKQGGIIGRRLDFLLQELNREANTLGSKSVDSLITHCAVEMKVLTEQMREQIQNIE
jgi:uncharacterized protein (TIGR00255 family)